MPLARSRARTLAAWVGAVLLAILFLAAGLWKLTDPYGAAARLAEARVPQPLSIPAAVGLGIVESFAGITIVVPRWRRLGACIAAGLLAAFMIFIAVHYRELRGEECNCFPWIRRAIGPGFFIGDGVMLILAVAAAALSSAAARYRSAAAVLAGVCAIAAVSFIARSHIQAGTRAPASITAENGQSLSLESGRVFIFFFNPQCMHCLEAGRKLAALDWGGTRFIGVPTENARFGDWFMSKAGLKDRGPVSRDLDTLRKTFPFEIPPAAVALENGREKAMLLQFEGDEPARTLKQLGFVQ